MSEFSLLEVLKNASEVEYRGQRFHVVYKNLDAVKLGVDFIQPNIVVVGNYSSYDDELDWRVIDLDELLDDPNLKVFHSTQVGFHRD